VSSWTPTPLILDTSVLTAIARGDPDIIGLIQGYDSRSQSMVIPALAIAGACLDTRSEEAADLLAGLELLDNVTVAPLNGPDRATRLADVVARTGLDAWDAHAAAIADVAVCPILTLNAAKWREHVTALDEPLHIIEIADPGGQRPEG
jgi:predicted nucleic acid-binding protein